MVVFLLILAACGLTAAALLTKLIVLAYTAVAVCVLCLAVLGRPLWHDLRARGNFRRETQEAEPAAPEEDDVAEAPSEPVEDAVVYVIPGRMRYHREGCALLDGRDHERLTLDEAHEEGFSRCTACGEASPAAEPHREGLRH